MNEEIEIRPIDAVFADFICDREAGDTRILRKAALHASSAIGAGNICVELAELFGTEVESASTTLLSSKMVGRPGDYCPLVLNRSGMLYLYRYWKYESDLAAALVRMAVDLPDVDAALLKDGLSRAFPDSHENPDWQMIAAVAAVRNRFCVISGGPGTGKTTTVVKIIALLLEQAKGDRMRVALAAPTGKAASKLKESIHNSARYLDNLAQVVELISGDVSTLQRLLGYIPDSCRFRHDAANPLPFELVVVDEASMVPLALMARLVDALAPGARLVLLGDRDQLASVEAGAVFGDICNTGHESFFSPAFRKFVSEIAEFTVPERPAGGSQSKLADSVAVLRTNYRFGMDSGIAIVSRAINEGETAKALDAMRNRAASGVTLIDTPVDHSLKSRLAKAVVKGFAGYLACDDPGEAISEFDRFRVLCALRRGAYGVDAINGLIEECLSEAGLIRPDRQWYYGRPVMVTANDYSLRLFNGDVGVTLNDPESEIGVSVYFPSVDGNIRKFQPYRLPSHETVFAMTVHKSQGSEFGSVLLIMPPSRSQILSREILYTGITRARNSVELWCSEAIFTSSCERTVMRRSGLRSALWGDESSIELK